jgi:hypothetical protein
VLHLPRNAGFLAFLAFLARLALLAFPGASVHTVSAHKSYPGRLPNTRPSPLLHVSGEAARRRSALDRVTVKSIDLISSTPIVTGVTADQQLPNRESDASTAHSLLLVTYIGEISGTIFHQMAPSEYL